MNKDREGLIKEYYGDDQNKISDNRAKELKEKVLALRRENNMRKLDVSNKDSSRMDVDKINKKFNEVYPYFQRDLYDNE